MINGTTDNTRSRSENTFIDVNWYQEVFKSIKAIRAKKVAIQFGDISSKIPDSAHSSCLEDQERGWSGNKMVRTHRSPSVMKAAEVAQIPHVPVILFIGGPGGGKTRHAARIANTFADQGLAHICMPDVIRNALLKYKERYSEWKAANDCYLRGR
ncbi:hypothetical protein V3C99_018595 [Haemonchus contortus]